MDLLDSTTVFTVESAFMIVGRVPKVATAPVCEPMTWNPPPRKTWSFFMTIELVKFVGLVM